MYLEAIFDLIHVEPKNDGLVNVNPRRTTSAGNLFRDRMHRKCLRADGKIVDGTYSKNLIHWTRDVNQRTSIIFND